MSAAWLAVLALLVGGRRHPMHTAVAEVAQEAAGERIAIRIRVFTDDLAAALPAAAAGVATADAAIARYVRGTFALADRNGRPVRLVWGGVEQAGDVVLLRLRGEVPGGLAGARITSLLLCERFADQVNIVRATYGDRTTTLLFTRGETDQALP